MTQGDVLAVLKKENKWMNSKDLANLMNISIASATNSLRKLRKTDFIEFKLIVGSVGKMIFIYKYNYTKNERRKERI